MIEKVIREARMDAGVGLRELARQSGVSPAQISRIEAGDVAQPSVDTLISIARALDRNPAPLLIVSGHIGELEGREILARMFRPNRGRTYDPEIDSELVETWLHFGWEGKIAKARTLLEDDNARERDLRKLAGEVFCTAETAETLWRDSYIESVAHRNEDDELIRLANLWHLLPRERRAKLIEYATEQAELTRIAASDRGGPIGERR